MDSELLACSVEDSLEDLRALQTVIGASDTVVINEQEWQLRVYYEQDAGDAFSC